MISFATTESNTSCFLTIRGYRDSAASHDLPGASWKPVLLTLPGSQTSAYGTALARGAAGDLAAACCGLVPCTTFFEQNRSFFPFIIIP